MIRDVIRYFTHSDCNVNPRTLPAHFTGLRKADDPAVLGDLENTFYTTTTNYQGQCVSVFEGFFRSDEEVNGVPKELMRIRLIAVHPESIVSHSQFVQIAKVVADLEEFTAQFQ